MSIDHSLPARLVFERCSIDMPLVSIVIPTYRRDNMLAEALSSALLQDTQVPIEIVVVDNDPESVSMVLGTLDLATTRHSLRYYVNETNLGMFGNWNQGLSLSRGRWVTLLHDDDWLSPYFVSSMLPLVQDGIDFAVCCVAKGKSGYDPQILPRWLDSDRVHAITIDDLIFGNPSPAPGVLILRQVLAAAGGFNPSSYPSGDYITYAQCASRVRAARLNRTLAYYRTTDSQTFKENTLRSMIEQSISIKQDLLRNAPPASALTFILSMAFWFRLARQHGKLMDGLALDWRLKSAAILSRVRVVTLVLETVRKGVKRIASILSS